MLDEIRAEAGAGGVSAFLNDAAKRQLSRVHTLRILDELDAKYGTATSQEKTEIAAEFREVFR